MDVKRKCKKKIYGFGDKYEERIGWLDEEKKEWLCDGMDGRITGI